MAIIFHVGYDAKHVICCREWTFVDGVRMSTISEEKPETVPATSPTSTLTKRKRSTTRKNPSKKERKCIADGKQYLSYTADFHMQKPLSEDQRKEQQQLQLKGTWATC
jgi:hypothetical protein